jgi:hypothetical protein
MRGSTVRQHSILSVVMLDELVPADYPIRPRSSAGQPGGHLRAIK